MSDYTPDSREIRSAYIFAATDGSYEWCVEADEAAAEFDRWLAEVKAAAWDECLEALAWAMDNGHPGDAIRYVATNNPHRTP